jgi:Glycosyl transferase family 11
MDTRFNGARVAPVSNTNAEVSGQDRPKWTHALPVAVRSLCRPLLHKWQHFCGVSREKLREKLAAPGVTSYLMGGCANQIFQYATGLALARRLRVDLKLDVSWYETATPSQPRMYSLGLFKGVDARVVHRLGGQIIHEGDFSYKPALFENVSRACSLVGYWQCEKYFLGLRDELRRRLLPREPLPARSMATERAILNAGERSVFATVRRTDYVGNPYHVVLPMNYYREAAALIAAKVAGPVFFVFSDDPEWCKANFKLPYPTTIAGNFDRTVEHHLGREDAELYLMRLCGHAIMANSSYSWWGAWLGADVKGGIVIAPKNWLGPAFNKDDARDIIPARWTRL